jgi:hypothetical protein
VPLPVRRLLVGHLQQAVELEPDRSGSRVITPVSGAPSVGGCQGIACRFTTGSDRGAVSFSSDFWSKILLGIFSQEVPRPDRIWAGYFVLVKDYYIGLFYTESQKCLRAPQFRKTEPAVGSGPES